MISSLTSSNLFRTVFNNAVSNQFTENSQESLSVDDLVGASVLHELSSKNAPYSLTSSSPYMDQLNFINDAHNADETEKFQHLIRNQKEKISSTLVNEEWIQKPQVQEINSRRTIFDISSSSILSQPSESSFLLKKSFLEQDIENAQNIHSQKASKYKLQDEKAHFQLSSSSSSDFLQNDAISSDIVISKNVTLKTLEKTYGCDMQTDDGLSKSSRIAGVKKSELLSKWQREDASDATAFFLSKREKDPGANVKKSEINFDEKIDKNEENSDAFSENSSVFEMSYKTEGEQNEEGEEGEMPSSKSNKYYKMRQATVKKQVREAKEYFQLFGEWVSKEWGIDEREAAMWEKARRKTMKEEEQNANEIKTGMASEATVEEMRSRLMEAQAEGAEGKEVDELKKEIEKREKKLEKRQKSEELTGLERFWIQEEKKKAEKMRREKSEEGGANEEDKVKFGYWLISEESPFKFTDTFSREWIRSIKNTHSKRGNTTDSDEIHSKFQPETNQQRQKALPYLSSSVQQELPDAPESMTFLDGREAKKLKTTQTILFCIPINFTPLYASLSHLS
ncbi:uncharacterized protein MONOS_9397 [Monocercomonoides exilis]|uniref:uncharacterized protein n=1 Tax=Monocercomonoides exilis TaxID=2049356 RepID=UPI00355A67DB|nr:hypothetical protein MONOS_9397 [Monocercomonoides exilis]|eukprot:MONOS_9397.1-p1 / transcript=MONOS_9397.1 / gene=MONOS_9397 / organism=Monocercomonoides_exilis_PA203 / gene_product=unspecified product / transcript_product=unspecified product / location=Mono_scaffold00387:8093-10215(+) / protein_length=566 / sequence_SO=supercontig / SO=protein_coding / is_pseudo=false